MKTGRRVLALFMSLVFLTFGGTMTASAEEAPAPFTAQQLMEQVKAQCALVGSVREVLTESVQMRDSASGKTVTANLSTDIRQSKTAIHTVMSASIVAGGDSSSLSEESYASVENGVLSTYSRDETGTGWKLYQNALTPEQLVDYQDMFGIICIDVQDATVAVDGNIIRLRTNLTASSMKTFVDMFEEVGISTQGASFPVVMEFDATTFLPLNMKIDMNGMTVSGMSRVKTTAVAEVTFSDYNLYNDMVVPAEVIAGVR